MKAVGLYHFLIKIFEAAFVGHENKRVPLSEIFNPIYLALNSLDSEGKTVNLAPGKEQIVRQIRAFTKAK